MTARREVAILFGSAALETAIGLAAMFFLLATAVSAITESISRLFNKRARDLERALAALFTGERMERTAKPGADPAPLGESLRWLEETSVWKSAQASAGVTLFRRRLKGPNYLSAKMFADAVVEMLTQHPVSPVQPPATDPATEDPDQRSDQAPTEEASSEAGDGWPANLRQRLDTLVAEGRHDLLSLKAGLEGWFDEAMDRAQGAYKRWATLVSFALGLFLAVVLNLSTIQVATTLWQEPATRQAVVNASHSVEADKTKIKNVAEAQNQITALQIPGGWRDHYDEAWRTFGSDWQRKLYDLLGWLLTAFLVMLGAPFWFDALSKLVSLRATGTKPLPAVQDDASATMAAASAMTVTPSVATPGIGPATVTTAVTPAGPASSSFAASVGLVSQPRVNGG